MTRKICISGPSGTGKTTLAMWMAKHYNIAYLDGSGKKIWGDRAIGTDDITNHQDIITKSYIDPIWGLKYQENLLDYRATLMNSCDNWVMDRGPLDNMVYFLLQVSPMVGEKTSMGILNEALVLYGEQTHQIITILSPDIPLTRDGKRVPNRFYQMTTDAVYERVFKNQLRHIKNVKSLGIFIWNLDKRKQQIMTFMSNIISPNDPKLGGIRK